MTKVGIITYHFARNYGAALQCYALWSYLHRCGHEPYILDYMSAKQEANNSLHNKRSGLKNVAMNIALAPFAKVRAEKEKRFSEFEGKLEKTPRIRTLPELESYVNAEGFDVLISGSDQVFNPRIGDFEEAFFLPIRFNGVKASFAASIGAATREDLVAYSEALKDFSYIGIREKNACDIVAALSEKNVYAVPDPVFLLGPDEWSGLASESHGFKDDGYVLCYYLGKEHASAYLRIAKEVADASGLPLKVINARYSLDSFRPCMIHDAGPIEFVSLFRDASYICTDSFHGTAFSVIFDKPFISFEPTLRSADTRKRDLLSAVGEEGRSVHLDKEESVASASRTCLAEIGSKTDARKRLMDIQQKYLGMFVG